MIGYWFISDLAGHDWFLTEWFAATPGIMVALLFLAGYLLLAAWWHHQPVDQGSHHIASWSLVACIVLLFVELVLLVANIWHVMVTGPDMNDRQDAYLAHIWVSMEKYVLLALAVWTIYLGIRRARWQSLPLYVIGLALLAEAVHLSA